MDGVSTAVGLVVNTYKAVKYIQKTLDDIKDAPNELQSLKDRVADIQMLTRELQQRELDGLFEDAEDLQTLASIGRRTQICIDDVLLFHTKMQKLGTDGASGLRKLKWLRKGTRLADLLGRLGDLQGTLGAMLTLVNSRAQAREEQARTLTVFMLQDLRRGMDESHVRLSDIQQRARARSLQPAETNSNTQDVSAATAAACTPPSHTHYANFAKRLRCQEGCPCRCHATFTQSTLPQSLVPYLGQVRVSRRLLHMMQLSPWHCNVQTCMRDKTAPYALNWSLPLSSVHAEWSLQVKLPWLHISVHAPRVIPYAAEVWRMIRDEDLVGIQRLFRCRRASIYDVNEDGDTLLGRACNQWHGSRSDTAQQVVMFLAEAGADLGYQPGNVVSAKTLLFEASLSTLLKHPADKFAHHIQSDPISISICRSAFGVDMADVALDVLDQLPICDADADDLRAALGFGALTTSPSPSLDKSWLLWHVTGFTLLEYSIQYMSPADALGLLDAGEDASYGVPLAHAAWRQRDDLFAPLLAAGADVNAVDCYGYATLHWACYNARLDMLHLLVDLVDEWVDWHARTQDWRRSSAVQVLGLSPYWDVRPAGWMEEMEAILRERGVRDRDGEGEEDDGPLKMPGGLE